MKVNGRLSIRARLEVNFLLHQTGCLASRQYRCSEGDHEDGPRGLHRRGERRVRFASLCSNNSPVYGPSDVLLNSLRATPTHAALRVPGTCGDFSFSFFASFSFFVLSCFFLPLFFLLPPSASESLS